MPEPSSKKQLKVFAGTAALVLVLGAIDTVTGDDFEMFVFYFIPIVLAAWYAGHRWSIAISLISAATWCVSDIYTSVPYSYIWGPWDAIVRLISFLVLAMALSKIKDYQFKLQAVNQQLTDAMAQIKQLTGIVPMCSFCRKIRDEKQHWIPLEQYITDHSEAQVSHGLCPSCYKKHYGEADGT